MSGDRGYGFAQGLRGTLLTRFFWPTDSQVALRNLIPVLEWIELPGTGRRVESRAHTFSHDGFRLRRLGEILHPAQLRFEPAFIVLH